MRKGVFDVTLWKKEGKRYVQWDKASRDGWIHGDYATHQIARSRWLVTHLPSGLTCGEKGVTQAEAKAAIKILNDAAVKPFYLDKEKRFAPTPEFLALCQELKLV